MRAKVSALLFVALVAPSLAAVSTDPDTILELAQSRFSPEGAVLVERALAFASRSAPELPNSEAQPRPLVVARSLLLDDEAVRAESVAAVLLIGNDASLQAIAQAVGPEVALSVRQLRKPGLLPGCAAHSAGEAEANLAQLSSDLERAVVYAHVDALRPGRRPDLALTCIRDARSGLLPALRQSNPTLAQSLREDVEHLERRYAAELSGQELLAEYRRADGTLDWTRLPAKQKQAFSLDLFLRELVAVVHTGERLRMEQFFAGLAETDFFEHYGAFALGGARQVVNARYLSRYLKPQFVEELMRSNVNLILGQHVSQIARGEVKAHVFSVSLTSLGLSAATVRAGMSALGFARRVQELKGVQNVARLSRLERLSGWVYVVAETAVVVYFSEWKNQWLQERHAEHRAKGGLEDAANALFRALSEADAPLTLPILEARVEAYQSAWDAYREFLLRPVFLAEQRASDALGALALEGKRLDDKRRAIVSRLQAYPGLARLVLRDHGALDAFAGASIQDAERALEAKLEVRVRDLLDERAALLAEVYGAPRRSRDYLEGAPDVRWHVRFAGRDLAPGDPGAGKDPLSAYGLREASRVSFRLRLSKLSKNRLQSYEDEAVVLRLVASFLPDQPELHARVDQALSETLRAAEIDRTLASPR
ncbi:MAG: hypothetical protein KDD82_17955 [Planctomycetes bacterium]|nr:hypothetical protein [Planctomycetota bacterium]